MVYRWSWLAAGGGLVFAFTGIDRLLRDTTDGTPWQLIVVAGLLLGAVITWTVLTYRLHAAWAAAVNLVAFVIAGTRIIAPDTAVALLPTGETLSRATTEIDFAAAIIRNGVAPVQPVAGVVLIVTAVFWATGAVMVWGLLRRHPYVGILPPFVLTLQFVTMDRFPIGALYIISFVALLAAALAAVVADERSSGTARIARRGSRLVVPTTSLGLVALIVIASVGVTGTAARAVPTDGVLTWRSSTGLTGSFFGSVSFNPFTSIRKGLVANSNIPVFGVRFDDSVSFPDTQDIYYRLLTLETFNGEQFFANQPVVTLPDPDDEWVDPEQVFQGPTERVRADIVIDELVMDWLPTVHSPVTATAVDQRVRNALRYRDDGSLRFEGSLSYEGLTYTLFADLPEVDVAALAADEDGELSPVFEAAAEGGETVPQPVAVETRAVPPDPERFLDLPESLDTGIGGLSARLTRNLETDFEKALALEAYFRDSDQFIYDTTIPTGHDSEDLAEWLLDEYAETNPEWHRGYCEQFATSMAVMARTLEIPSRVVLGFTPGRMNRDGIVVVTDSNAHAWVELWMPQQGWVQFDPTPRSDRINRPTLESIDFDVTPYLDIPDPEVGPAQAIPLPPAEFGPDVETGPDFIGFSGDAESTGGGFSLPDWIPTVTVLLIVLGVLFGLLPAVKWFRRRRRLARLRKGDITAAWEEITGRLADLGHRPDPTATPFEVAAGVDTQMTPLADQYAAVTYGPHTPDTARIDTATRSLLATEARLSTTYSPGKRLLALYRPGTLLPGAVRRRIDRRRGLNGNGSRPPANGASRRG